MGALFIGVDGGGTSTRCVVAGDNGEITGRGRAGGANVVSVADPAANLLAALLAALEGLDRSRVAGGVFGLAGVEAMGGLAERVWKEAGLPGRPTVVPDMLVAFTGATTEPDGTVLVAGTGAGGARIQHRQVVRRADGWGWLLGDEGSGVWIGRRAVAAALTALDGRAAPTALVDDVAAAILDDAAASGDGDGDRRDAPGLARAIVSAVYARVAESGPAWLATLAPVADAAARDGDPVAREILREGAALLCRTALAVRSRGSWGSRGSQGSRDLPDTADGAGPAAPGPLVLAGSLLTERTELAALVRAELGERAGLSAGTGSLGDWLLAGDAAAGAAALALRAVLPPDDPRALEGHRRLIAQGAR
ncbi:N-acetylglucosamine kinase [Sphaerimonospora thailandensis]|uniref:N-acetylglucosamine kinase n=1 Tax=Sphaerimonospora thailandensis TaxID=795644 RepID=UPI001EF214C8|nr:BadF/BadG/BcrA/BcrD ATPase family protein [Sphaerimonospora thailandensis]